MSSPEPLEIEGLLTEDQRRVTVDAHQAFRETLAPSPAYDPVDELAADPVLDRLPAYRSHDERSRLDAILDELDGRTA